jgi:hypothetical protein
MVLMYKGHMRKTKGHGTYLLLLVKLIFCCTIALFVTKTDPAGIVALSVD